MKMYVWTKEIMRDWSSGMAVGVAETVEEARAAILADAYGEWEGFDRMTSQLAQDLAADPDAVYDLPAGVSIAGGS